MFKIENNQGLSAEIINIGATVFSINVPDKNGKCVNIALGYDDPDSYKDDPVYFGTTAGRFGNRIARGKFELNGIKYALTLNNDGNHLHGGIKGLGQQIWQEEIISSHSIKFSCFSPDGDQGYPGNLNVSVLYSITEENGLRIEFKASTDAVTILNLTNHSYFNLSGSDSNSILDHEVYIDADKFTPVDKTMIPTGEIRNVDNTPMDFRIPKTVGQDINSDYEQIQIGNGFDHNWILNKYDGNVRKVASVFDPHSTRYMEVFTDQPGVQFYSGNWLEGIEGKNGHIYKSRSGLCLETQGFPDSPNHPHFPQTILKPGVLYKHITEYRFSNK